MASCAHKRGIAIIHDLRGDATSYACCEECRWGTARAGTNSIGLMIRIGTIQGSLARRRFVDADAAQRIIEPWPDEYEPLLDLIAVSADRDLATPAVAR